ncbi:MAG: cytosolic long-chain acyl-CoA thioester hydrolase family protein, partial [uncultured Craurococcus sp.]
ERHPPYRRAPHPHHRHAGRHQPGRRHLRRLADVADGPRRRQCRQPPDPWPLRDRCGGGDELPRPGPGRRRGQPLCRCGLDWPHLAPHPGRGLVPQPDRGAFRPRHLRRLHLRRARCPWPAASRSPRGPL